MRKVETRRVGKTLTAITAAALMLLSLQGTASADDASARQRSDSPRVEAQGAPDEAVPAQSLLPQLILDGGFEAGFPHPAWTIQTSTAFMTPLCDAGCGTGGGASPPRTGAFWAWFGGIPAPETATLGQTVTIPTGVTATLTFWMRIGTVTTPFTDVLNVKVDGTIVQTFTEPSVAEAAYTLRTINLNAFATGTPHTILFEYLGPTTGTGSFVVDDVELNTVATAGSLAPAALTVDGAGNGVLQPNEAAVVVAPRWSNTGSVASATATGALANFTGPTGPTYTINDGTGAYPAMAAGTQANCTDCYAVTAAAGLRPALHWDATAVETVSLGTAPKTWTLHVGDSFSDVPASSGFYRFVETLLHKGITSGCGATTYCPSFPTSREQMAVFVLVAKEGAGYSPVACGATPLFADVPSSSPFCRFIEELSRRGVVSGCGGGNYCPLNPVSREQMAIFALRTLNPAFIPPACGVPMFADVPASSPFCSYIEELARRGVVSGCGGGNYCPLAPVTREQMGVFLTATFTLALYGL